MERYKNLSGDSGVVAFEIRNDSIKVEFQEGGLYLYSESKPGKYHVDQMKRLARSGRGLSTYITRHVKNNYAEKIR